MQREGAGMRTDRRSDGRDNAKEAFQKFKLKFVKFCKPSRETWPLYTGGGGRREASAGGEEVEDYHGICFHQQQQWQQGQAHSSRVSSPLDKARAAAAGGTSRTIGSLSLELIWCCCCTFWQQPEGWNFEIHTSF